MIGLVRTCCNSLQYHLFCHGVILSRKASYWQRFKYAIGCFEIWQFWCYVILLLWGKAEL